MQSTKAIRIHNKESGGRDTNNFELLMQKHDRAYSACEFSRRYVCDNEMHSVLSRMAYWYYTTVNMLVYFDITNKTYPENHNLFWKFATSKKKKLNYWQWSGGGQNHIDWTISEVEIAARNPK